MTMERRSPSDKAVSTFIAPVLLRVFSARRMNHASNASNAMERALAHGDEHAIKLADTAADVYARSGDTRALSAAALSLELIAPFKG